MANVRAVETKGEKAAILVMDDDSRVWTPEFVKAAPLVGKPIPADWTQKQGEFGPQAFPPREKGGKAFSVAHRNTKEGQEYEQERMDRRTALMQAVTLWVGTAPGDFPDPGRIEFTSEEFYHWLRATKTSGGPAVGAKSPNTMASRPPEDSSESAGRRTQSAGKESESTNGEVAAPAPAGTIDAQTVKDLQAVLGGPTNALHAARARFGDSVHALKMLTPEQAKALLP